MLPLEVVRDISGGSLTRTSAGTGAEAPNGAPPLNWGGRGEVAPWVAEGEPCLSLSSNLWSPIQGLGTQQGESQASGPRVVGSECSLTPPSRCRTAVPEWGWHDRAQSGESSGEVHCPSRGGGTGESPLAVTTLLGLSALAGYACSQLALFWKELYGEIVPTPCLALCLAFLFLQ